MKKSILIFDNVKEAKNNINFEPDYVLEQKFERYFKGDKNE